MNDLIFMNIFQSNCKLGENVLCLLLIQMILSKRFCIIWQVTSILELSDNMDFAANLEEVSYIKHVIALLASLLGFNFWDSEIICFWKIVLRGYCFYNNLDTE